MVQWTAEKDALLLRIVFEKCDIKATKALCEDIAAAVGEDCTAKAVSLRLYGLKSKGKPNNASPSKSSNPGTPRAKVGKAKAATSTPTPTPRSAHSRAKGRKKKQVDESRSAEDEHDERKLGSPTPGVKRERIAGGEVGAGEEVVEDGSGDAANESESA